MPSGDRPACGRCSCWNVILLSGFVNLTTMADSENEDYEVVVVYFVNGAIVACARAPFAASTHELNQGCANFTLGTDSRYGVADRSMRRVIARVGMASQPGRFRAS